jgi:phosphoribosylformylglycinamidine synthase
VCVGADPDRLAILDNFCWPSCAKPENLGALVRAAAGCYDAAKTYRTPFVSGKDSLNNQFTTKDGRTIEIPPTLLITGIGIVADVERCVTSDAKHAGSALVLVGPACDTLGGSVAARLIGGTGPPPRTDLEQAPRVARAVAKLIELGLVRSTHDVSEGGLLAAIAEMLIGAGGEIGARLDLDGANPAELFGEAPSRYVLEIDQDRLDEATESLGELPHRVVGAVDDSGRLHGSGLDLGVGELTRAFTTPHDGSAR